MRFRTQIFLTALLATSITGGVATLLLSWSLRARLLDDIERDLVAKARLAAEAISHQPALSAQELDDEADALGETIRARVTLVAADGAVVGDSAEDGVDLGALENHGHRPEIVDARRNGVGVARRYSTTVEADLLYVAVPTLNPSVATVRLAVPLTAIDQQVGSIWRLALVALGVGLLIALALAWSASTVLSRRLTAIAATARRYASGDLSRPSHDYADDEIGTVARVLDESIRELGRRLTELSHDRARMAAMLSGMIEGVLVVSGQQRVQLANDAARAMLGLREAPLGRHYLELVRHPDIAAAIGSVLAGGAPDSRELTLRHGEGRRVVARVAGIEAPGGRAAVVVLHDITDLRRADEIRRDFVANVSHELRTPLTAIRGYIEALQDAPQDPEDARHFLEVIARHTLRMERLVQDLLRLARLDAGQEVLERTECPLEGLFAGVQTELMPAIEDRRQRIEVDIDPSTATVAGDPAKLHDVLRNLIENAVNYSPPGSTITLAARATDDQIAIVVQDEGPGIPEADLTRIFERFYRVDRARSREMGGTGLGLSIVKHLVGLHGGTVRAANRPDRGAIFTVTLPRPQT